MDNTSKWHTSGLLSVALETCTLPTRIRDNNSTGRLGRLGDISTLLNVSGNQKIANLTMSVDRTEEKIPPVSPVAGPSRDSASRIELSWDSGGAGIRGKKIDRDGHLFAEVEVMRGFNEEQVMEETATSRASQWTHDRQDAIIGRWENCFLSDSITLMCFAFWGTLLVLPGVLFAPKASYYLFVF